MIDKKRYTEPLSLNCYTIRFNERNKNVFIKIKDVFKSSSFIEEMTLLSKKYKEFAFVNDNENRMLHLNETLSLQENLFTGVMKRGHNGQETDIDELLKGKPNTLSTVKSDHYNSIYFYFLLHLPNPETDYLLFMAQTYRQYGFKELFEESFKSYIKDRYNNEVTCTISPLTIPKLFSKYIKEGDVRKLRFKKHSLPQNAENLLGPEDSKNQKDYELETSIKAKKKGFTGIKNIDFEKTTFVEVFSNLGIEYDEVYADISINGRKRVINITNPDKFTASFDITNQVSKEQGTQKPVFKEMNIEAIKILKEEILIFKK